MSLLSSFLIYDISILSFLILYTFISIIGFINDSNYFNLGEFLTYLQYQTKSDTDTAKQLRDRNKKIIMTLLIIILLALLIMSIILYTKLQDIKDDNITKQEELKELKKFFETFNIIKTTFYALFTLVYGIFFVLYFNIGIFVDHTQGFVNWHLFVVVILCAGSIISGLEFTLSQEFNPDPCSESKCDVNTTVCRKLNNNYYTCDCLPGKVRINKHTCG